MRPRAKAGRFPTLRRAAFWVFAGGLFGLAACSEKAPQSTTLAVTLKAHLPEGSIVVARVNGRPITAQEVAAQASRGQGPRKALQELIALELLASEAARRGLNQAPDVLETQRRSMARRLIRTGFGDGFTKDRVPMWMVRLAYRKMRGLFVHAELSRVVHIVVRAEEDKDAQTHARALALCKDLHKQATAAPLTEEAFRALGERFRAEHPEQPLVIEQVTTERVGRTVREFAEAAFALRTEGEISPVVKTRFGYHVLRFKERIPARNVSVSEAAAEIREHIFEQARREMFLQWVADLEKKRSISVDQALVQRATGDPASKAALPQP